MLNTALGKEAPSTLILMYGMNLVVT
jgi:hypothetical protein